jgi:hypothetical protein
MIDRKMLNPHNRRRARKIAQDMAPPMFMVFKYTNQRDNEALLNRWLKKGWRVTAENSDRFYFEYKGP